MGGGAQIRTKTLGDRPFYPRSTAHRVWAHRTIRDHSWCTDVATLNHQGKRQLKRVHEGTAGSAFFPRG